MYENRIGNKYTSIFSVLPIAFRAGDVKSLLHPYERAWV
jgi:hypothetical protein